MPKVENRLQEGYLVRRLRTRLASKQQASRFVLTKIYLALYILALDPKIVCGVAIFVLEIYSRSCLHSRLRFVPRKLAIDRAVDPYAYLCFRRIGLALGASAN